MNFEEDDVTHSRRSVRAGALLALLMAGCAPVSVQVDYDPKVDFSGYRSWGWLAEPETTGNAGADDPALHRLIRAAIEAQLESQGYVTARDPQLRFGYHVSTQERVDVRTVSSPYPPAHWDGGNAELRVDTETYVRESERGRLVIDVVDTSRNALVWRGVGERTLRREPTADQLEQTVRKTVAEILGRFPPGAGG